LASSSATPADEIEAACGDGSAWGLNLTYIRQDAPLGLAHAVKIAEDFIAGDAFVMYLGDNLLPAGIHAAGPGVRRAQA